MWSVSLPEVIINFMHLVIIGSGLGLGITFAQKLLGSDKRTTEKK